LSALECEKATQGLLGHFVSLGLIADFTLPIEWSLLATIPIGMFSWWVAYRSDWI